MTRSAALAVLCAATLAVAAPAAAQPPKPELTSGLTIPELVAGLEAAGYRDFHSVQSDQRRIVVEGAGPDGTPATVKYWPETGRVLVRSGDPDGADAGE